MALKLANLTSAKNIAGTGTTGNKIITYQQTSSYGLWVTSANYRVNKRCIPTDYLAKDQAPMAYLIRGYDNKSYMGTKSSPATVLTDTYVAYSNVNKPSANHIYTYNKYSAYSTSGSVVATITLQYRFGTTYFIQGNSTPNFSYPSKALVTAPKVTLNPVVGYARTTSGAYSTSGSVISSISSGSAASTSFYPGYYYQFQFMVSGTAYVRSAVVFSNVRVDFEGVYSGRPFKTSTNIAYMLKN